MDPVTLAAIISAAPAAIDLGKGFYDDYQLGKRRKAADGLIDNFLKNPGSQFVNPALLKQAQAYAFTGSQGDPQVESVARDWLQGQGGVPYDTNLANQLLRGDIPPSVAATLDRQLGHRFDRFRRSQGGQLARSGVLNSTIGGRLMADTYDSQRNALADAYMNTLVSRQQLGLGILNAADLSKRAYQGMGASQLGRLADRNLAYQQLGFNVLSDADRRNFAKQSFGLNAKLGSLGMQQARVDARMENAGNILGNLFTNYRDEQRFNTLMNQQNDQFSQMLKLSSGGGRNNISPIQAKANLKAIEFFGPNSATRGFKSLGEMRQGAGGYGSRNNPLSGRM